eukprot:TRINITY_DN1155_c0_g1_i4.p2 TRINITY_DN1155_c0_g1~~TRINITY_DN1155_c0_g1_i4.p2  ORF type:complete len:177 (-),score=36.08 TRINITY_DN1155_c0_g1_i4:448-978(-)
MYYEPDYNKVLSHVSFRYRRAEPSLTWGASHRVASVLASALAPHISLSAAASPSSPSSSSSHSPAISPSLLLSSLLSPSSPSARVACSASRVVDPPKPSPNMCASPLAFPDSECKSKSAEADSQSSCNSRSVRPRLGSPALKSFDRVAELDEEDRIRVQRINNQKSKIEVIDLTED